MFAMGPILDAKATAMEWKRKISTSSEDIKYFTVKGISVICVNTVLYIWYRINCFSCRHRLHNHHTSKLH